MFIPKKMGPVVYEAREGEKLWKASMNLLGSIDPDHPACLVQYKFTNIHAKGPWDRLLSYLCGLI